MAIFNKLTGLAQRAKDGAMTKVVLAKDKRLEQSFSEALDLDKIRLGKMSTYGLPEVISTVAYDSVASLLAVAGGSTQYSIRVFGKGMSARLQLHTLAPVKYMQFKIGSPMLIVIDRDNRISLMDLKTKQPSHVLEGDGIITCFEYCVGTDWLYLGYADGYVKVLDLKTASLSPYRIPDLWHQQMPPATHDRFCSIVTAIQIHPTDLDLLLVGYPSAVFLWSIRENSVKRTFKLPSQARLTCLSWCPEGDRWMGGYDDGCINMWDMRSDTPIFSRKVFQAPAPSSACEPVYSLAWYIDDTLQKSFVIVAGGSEIPGLFGLHVLEIDTNTKECRKQTIVPSPVDISSFVLMPRDPYFLGARHPLGVLVLGCDGTLRAHSLAHGYPLLTLPPALQFLDPPVSHACPVLVKPAAFELLRPPHIPTQYLPLAGGVVGSEHTYRISSNDILITLHPDSSISFYDASYTALRPLPHLTRNCRHDLQDPLANIHAFNLDPDSATLSVGFDTGAVLIYHLVEAAVPEDNIVTQCDSTLKEISDLLQDMDMLPDEQIPFEPLETPDFPVDITTFEFNQPNVNKYLPVTLIKLQDTSIKYLVSAGKDIIALATTDGKVALIDTKTSRVMFSSDMRIHVFKENIPKESVSKEPLSKENPQKENITKENAPKDTTWDDILNVGKESPNLPNITVTYLGFFTSYSQFNMIEPTLQLYVALSNGSTYHYAVNAGPSDRTWIPAIAPSIYHYGPVIDLFVLNLRGHLQTVDTTTKPIDLTQTAKSTASVTPPLPPTVDSSSPDSNVPAVGTMRPDPAASIHTTLSTSSIPASTGSVVETPPITPQSALVTEPEFISESPTKSSPASPVLPPKSSRSRSGSLNLLRKSSRKSNKQTAQSNENVPPVPKLPTGRSNDGRPDYKVQPDPHFIVLVNSNTVRVALSGYQVRLFKTAIDELEGWKTGDWIIRGQVIELKVGTCLSLLLQSGKIVLYSLPTLRPLVYLEPPPRLLVDRLHEATLTADGRITLWTGRFELEQYTYMLQNEISFGESVMLYDPGRMLGPRPVTVTPAPKKTWLGTVTNAFQKEPLSIEELDDQMGRHPPPSVEENTHKHDVKGKGVFEELGDQMNERGDRLNQLDKKFQDMSDASGDFLKAIQEYNERQAKKKWWEF
ncbi:hypothetical protein J3Q64DRAFT_1853622 [Phycomyces blakesleeanus]|uniref:Lethal giant larvae (Lgl)-like C-terminal domain-containing protein n=2 Tax=Phycomyces blakesleeanus TaxID=4837 RepID=A0A167JCW0_PHYB8|nr:hypothetical protein PHYBLDRAFT_80334 [Phycomyces blakesleeanus NRRL 1555(-)]OAD65739.1 hypothetical protein PHYBLDRAFT_80334 [Phycomyces blakesleeanus NRRL 1555(-)]|eukprot:XP_018283779.1 hypothetical protein PHYBLDRAFT_80334 [Phycomyces blakesleeanus NRRL 1555(-)]